MYTTVTKMDAARLPTPTCLCADHSALYFTMRRGRSSLRLELASLELRVLLPKQRLRPFLETWDANSKLAQGLGED